MFKIPSKSTGMLLDGIFCSSNVDSSGETIDIKGLDATSLEEGEGTVNYEHKGEDDGGFGKETVGKIVYVKKIFKESDCEDDRQREYFKKTRGASFLYGVARLFDGAGHAEAKALAAAIRDHVANHEPISLRWSIEGTTVSKVGGRIEKCIARRVALTWKPCNKAAASGVLADPNAPDGFGVTTKSESEDPGYSRIGGSTEIVCDPTLDSHDAAKIRLLAAAASFRVVRKALGAGGGDAAPGTLSGGAALGKEDLRGTAFATLRDYGWSKPFRRSEFKAFAKTKLPEVSDDFLDHFADVAEGLVLKRALEKREPGVEKPKKAPKIKLPGKKISAPAVIIPPEHQAVNHAVLEDISDADESEPEKAGGGRGRKLPALTFRGVPTKPNNGMTRPVFDPDKGILHTPAGSIRAYLPEHDGPESAKNYESILRHPEIEKAMDTAISNWSRLHGLLKAGKLPPEVVMHAVMFAQLSPNKPVPTQEIQYARLADAMDATGIDPRYPGFEEIEEPYKQLDQPDRLPHVAREEFARNPAYYQGGKIGVDTDEQGNKMGRPSLETGRYPGELLSGRPLFQDFLGRASQYHKLHDNLVSLIQKHRHNGFDAVSELMRSKNAGTNHANMRRTAIKAGKPDPGEFKGMAIPGIKVKTGLYTLGMMGAGDSLVPDTHEVRNLYGLDLDKDAATIEYLKSLHWRPTNMKGVMGPLNQWYLKNHPAVKYTLEHPKWGSTFERPQDALFPAFWRHWLTIQPHEKFLGLPNQSEQAGTTHAPYWEAIRPHIEEAMEKSVDDPDSSVALRTALVHQQYVKDYGEVPAMFMYYHHLVPKLIEAADRRRKTGDDLQFLAKARLLENTLVELRKDVSEAIEGPKYPDVHAVNLRVGDKMHPAGRFMVHNGNITHLEDYHGVLQAMLPEGPMNAISISRLHGMKWAPHLSVSRSDIEAPVEHHDTPATIDVQPVAPPPPPPVFEYHRPGMKTPAVVEFGPHGPAMDGHALTDAEIALMVRNADSGLATIKYHRPGGGSLAKADRPDADTSDMDVETALHNLWGRHPESHEELGRIRRSLFEDPMNPGVGNKLSYQTFRNKNRPGVWVSGDANDFKSVNDIHGHDAGDSAISNMGGALRNAAAQVGSGKLFRPGGDEFVAHFPTYEHAAQFLRHARGHLDAIPPINGVHKLSMSFGLGPDFATADKALGHAKSQKKVSPKGILGGVWSKITGSNRRAFPVGKTPHLAHSLVPGTEGPISMHSEQPAAHHMPSVSRAQTT
jgi:GGDEF domain-containing protein